jgi:hypothetical protein
MAQQKADIGKANQNSGDNNYYSANLGSIFEKVDALGKMNLKANEQIMDLMLLYGKASVASDSLDTDGFTFETENAPSELKILKAALAKVESGVGGTNYGNLYKKDTPGNEVYKIEVTVDGKTHNLTLTENTLKLMDAVLSLKDLAGIPVSDKAILDLMAGRSTDEARAYLTEVANMKLGIISGTVAKAINKLLNIIQDLVGRLQR